MFLFFLPVRSADHSARGGHLRVGDRTDRRAGHHRPAGLGGRRGGRVVLADGLQEGAERERPAAAPHPSAEPDVHEPRPDVRTIAGLPNLDFLYSTSFTCTALDVPDPR